MQGRDSSAHAGTAHEHAARPDDAPVAFYPMTFPIVIGPGTVTALVVYSGQAATPADWAVYAGVFAAVLGLLGVVLFFAADLAGYLSQTARAILTRLMGMILAAIAVEMIATGLKALLPGLG
jgi:multiple antibiotic resistance protein